MRLETEKAAAALDAHTREIVDWHFDPATGSPFWLDFATKLPWDPRAEIKSFRDLSRFPPFEDEWLRGGPVQRWIPQGLAGKPTYVFETGGTTGVPKTRVAFDDLTHYQEAAARVLALRSPLAPPTVRDTLWESVRDWPRGRGQLELVVQRGAEQVSFTFTPRTVPFFPTQLYETVSMLLLMLVLLAFQPFRSRDGEVMVVLMLGYAGFLIMTSGGSEERISSGWRVIKIALTGLAIIAVAYIVVKFVFDALGVGDEFRPVGL